MSLLDDLEEVCCELDCQSTKDAYTRLHTHLILTESTHCSKCGNDIVDAESIYSPKYGEENKMTEPNSTKDIDFLTTLKIIRGYEISSKGRHLPFGSPLTLSEAAIAVQLLIDSGVARAREEDARKIKDYETQQVFDKKCLDDSFAELKRQDATIKELREALTRYGSHYGACGFWHGYTFDCEFSDIYLKVRK